MGGEEVQISVQAQAVRTDWATKQGRRNRRDILRGYHFEFEVLGKGNILASGYFWSPEIKHDLNEPWHKGIYQNAGGCTCDLEKRRVEMTPGKMRSRNGISTRMFTVFSVCLLYTFFCIYMYPLLCSTGNMVSSSSQASHSSLISRKELALFLYIQVIFSQRMPLTGLLGSGN